VPTAFEMIEVLVLLCAFQFSSVPRRKRPMVRFRLVITSRRVGLVGGWVLVRGFARVRRWRRGMDHWA